MGSKKNHPIKGITVPENRKTKPTINNGLYSFFTFDSPQFLQKTTCWPLDCFNLTPPICYNLLDRDLALSF